jgi:hypothetical protein
MISWVREIADRQQVAVTTLKVKVCSLQQINHVRNITVM